MLIERKNIAAECDRLRAENKKIVFTNGCFDLLHVGHVRYLTAARALGDVLIVGLDSDSSMKKLKGADRPINAARISNYAAGIAVRKPGTSTVSFEELESATNK